MRRWIATGLLAGSLIATGCAGGYVGYEVRIPPPPLRVETYGPAPGPGYIWIKGYWGYSGGNYVWQGGRWEQPPRGRRQWEDGRWERHGDRYRWREGRWR